MIKKKSWTKRKWYTSWRSSRGRCNNPNHPRYYRYGGRGIKNDLSKSDMEYLWERDKGWELEKHSLDRIDNNSGYTISNCQFIELLDNFLKNAKGGEIGQFKDGLLLQKFRTSGDAARATNTDAGSIRKAVKGLRKTVGGFEWRYMQPDASHRNAKNG